MDPDSARWVRHLSAGDPDREAATVRLHGLLVRAAHVEAARRSGFHGVVGVELNDLADQAAADATLSILRRVDTFRGESRFTTWAYKFVVLEVGSKLARHAWRRQESHPEPELWERLPDALAVGPEGSVVAAELLAAVRRGVEQVMTAHQRRVFVSLVLQAVPLDVIVAELGTNRNAVYKTMFDARQKLRTYLLEGGYLDESSPPPAGAREGRR